MKGKSVVNFLSYIAIAFVAVALILVQIFSHLKWGGANGLINALNLIAQIIAYAITAFFAFWYAKSRKSIGWMIAYVIFVIVIIVFLVINSL